MFFFSALHFRLLLFFSFRLRGTFRRFEQVPSGLVLFFFSAAMPPYRSLLPTLFSFIGLVVGKLLLTAFLCCFLIESDLSDSIKHTGTCFVFRHIGHTAKRRRKMLSSPDKPSRVEDNNVGTTDNTRIT